MDERRAIKTLLRPWTRRNDETMEAWQERPRGVCDRVRLHGSELRLSGRVGEENRTIGFQTTSDQETRS